MTSFAFDWDPAYRVAALPFLITPSRARVVVDDGRLEVRFGPWRLRTRVDNVVEVSDSGDYAFVKTAGPPHLSFSDRGISFATNGRQGLCLTFAEPVPGIDPTGLSGRSLVHPGATLTVADPDGLRAALGLAAV